MIKIIIDDEQQKEMNEWIVNHQKSCSKILEHKSIFEETGYIPCGGWGEITLQVVYTSFGPIINVKCDCGEEMCIGEVEYYEDGE